MGEVSGLELKDKMFDKAGSVIIWLLAVFPLGIAVVKSWASASFVIIALGCVFLIRRKKAIPSTVLLRGFKLGLLLLLVATLLSWVHVDDFSYSRVRFEKIATLNVAFLLIPGFLRLPGEWYRKLWWGFVCSGPLMLVVAMHAVWIRHLPRAQGYYHPIIFGDLAMYVALILLGGLVSGMVGKGNCKEPWLVVASMVSAFVAATLSQTRGAWAAFPLVMFLLLWLYRRKLKLRMLVVAGGVFLVVVLGLPQLFPQSIGRQAERTLQSVESYLDGSQPNTSLGQRFMLWEIAFDVWKHHPLVGTGLGDFPLEVESRMRSGETELDYAWTHAHSIFAEALAVMGGLGLVTMFLAVFYFPFRFFVKGFNLLAESGGIERFVPVAGLITVVAFFAFGLSEAWLARSVFVHSYLIFLSVFIAATLLLLEQQQTTTDGEDPR